MPAHEDPPNRHLSVAQLLVIRQGLTEGTTGLKKASEKKARRMPPVTMSEQTVMVDFTPMKNPEKVRAISAELDRIARSKQSGCQK